MPRQQRYRLPGVPQHVIAALVGPSTCGTCASMHIARGNNRQVTFFDEGDYLHYLEDLQDAAEKWDCDIVALARPCASRHLCIHACRMLMC